MRAAFRCYSACMRGRLSERRHLGGGLRPRSRIRSNYCTQTVQFAADWQVPCKDLEMSDPIPRERSRDTDAAALDAITDLFRLPDRRIGDSRVLFIEDVADILSQVRDLSLPASAELLRDYNWAYKADGDCYIYDDLDERRMGSTTCDFCDRVFYRDDSNRYHGLSTRFRDHPDDPEGILVQEICDFCKEERPRGMWPEQLDPK